MSTKAGALQGVELGTAAAPDLGDGMLDRERRLVGPSVGHGVERVGDRDDPSRDRDRLATQAGGIAAAVPALVVGERDLGRDLQNRKATFTENAPADHGVGLDDLELLRRELARLEQDRVGNPDLADVVQGGRALDHLDQLLVQAQHSREQVRGVRDALGVPVGVVVAVLAHQRQALEVLSRAAWSSSIVASDSVMSANEDTAA